MDPRSMPKNLPLKRKLTDAKLAEALDGQAPAKRSKTTEQDARFDMIQHYREVARVEIKTHSGVILGSILGHFE